MVLPRQNIKRSKAREAHRRLKHGANDQLTEHVGKQMSKVAM